jgi:hypothetical protein
MWTSISSWAWSPELHWLVRFLCTKSPPEQGFVEMSICIVFSSMCDDCCAFCQILVFQFLCRRRRVYSWCKLPLHTSAAFWFVTKCAAVHQANCEWDDECVFITLQSHDLCASPEGKLASSFCFGWTQFITYVKSWFKYDEKMILRCGTNVLRLRNPLFAWRQRPPGHPDDVSTVSQNYGFWIYSCTTS